MSRFNKLSHTIYECKYHIVFCPKYRYQIFKDAIGEYTRPQIYRLCSQMELVEVLELNVQADHVHVVFSIPPKYSVSSLMGCLKGQTFHSSFRPIRKTGEVLLGSSFVGSWVLCEQRRFG